MRRFIDFDQKFLAGMPERMRRARDELAKVEGKDPAALARMFERTKEEDRKLRDAAGLTEAQVEAANDLMRAVAAVRRPAAAQHGQLDVARAAVKLLGPDEKPKAEEKLREMERKVAEGEALFEARRRYGDQAVDAAVKLEKELVALWAQHLKSFQEANRAMIRR